MRTLQFQRRELNPRPGELFQCLSPGLFGICMPVYELCGIPVQFPYDAYEPQLQYMTAAINALKTVWIANARVSLCPLNSREHMRFWKVPQEQAKLYVYCVLPWHIELQSQPKFNWPLLVAPHMRHIRA